MPGLFFCFQKRAIKNKKLRANKISDNVYASSEVAIAIWVEQKRKIRIITLI
jgi:hypothetical protein